MHTHALFSGRRQIAQSIEAVTLRYEALGDLHQLLLYMHAMIYASNKSRQSMTTPRARCKGTCQVQTDLLTLGDSKWRSAHQSMTIMQLDNFNHSRMEAYSALTIIIQS